jgi:heterotetrameric sarcosine oxidase gamma subunit
VAETSVPDISVAATGPIARSPIHQAGPAAVVDGWEISERRSGAALRLADWSCTSKILVRANGDLATAGALDVPFRSATWRSGPGERLVLVVGSGPGEWYLIGPPGTADRLLDDAMASSTAKQDEHGLVSVVDVTHGRALVRITGQSSARTLSKLCPIDLRDRTTPNGTAFRSTVGKLTVDVVRDDVGSALPSYLLHCERSTGQDLFDSLLDAGSEFQIDVDGFRLGPGGPPRP